MTAAWADGAVWWYCQMEREAMREIRITRKTEIKGRKKKREELTKDSVESTHLHSNMEREREETILLRFDLVAAEHLVPPSTTIAKFLVQF